MNLRHKMKRIESFDKLFAKYSSKSTIDQADDLYFLVDLVNILRPKKTKKLSGISIESLLVFLTEKYITFKSNSTIIPNTSSKNLSFLS